jgi:hypothetical protein
MFAKAKGSNRDRLLGWLAADPRVYFPADPARPDAARTVFCIYLRVCLGQ